MPCSDSSNCDIKGSISADRSRSKLTAIAAPTSIFKTMIEQAVCTLKRFHVDNVVRARDATGYAAWCDSPRHGSLAEAPIPIEEDPGVWDLSEVERLALLAANGTLLGGLAASRGLSEATTASSTAGSATGRAATSAEPAAAEALLGDMRARLHSAGYAVQVSPFGYFNEFRVHVAGPSLAKVFVEF